MPSAVGPPLPASPAGMAQLAETLEAGYAGNIGDVASEPKSHSLAHSDVSKQVSGPFPFPVPRPGPLPGPDSPPQPPQGESGHSLTKTRKPQPRPRPHPDTQEGGAEIRPDAIPRVGPGPKPQVGKLGCESHDKDIKFLAKQFRALGHSQMLASALPVAPPKMAAGHERGVVCVCYACGGGEM